LYSEKSGNPVGGNISMAWSALTLTLNS
jgi:hypothetical protein